MVTSFPLEQALSLRSYLNPDVTLKEIADSLQSGQLVSIREALPLALAEQVHQCLVDSPDWYPHDSYSPDFPRGPESEGFNYRHHNLYNPSLYPPALSVCRDIFASHPTRQFIENLTGLPCAGPTSFSASWYQPGDHSTPHNDHVANHRGQRRQVAFVWHLSKNWRPEWGGSLFWCPTGHYLTPSFNTLYLFNVTAESFHLVTQVSPLATSRRLTVNGWWLDAAEKMIT